MKRLFLLGLIVMVWGCAGYREETQRYHLPAGEGLKTAEVAVTGSKEDLWRLLLEWVNNRFYSETMTAEEKDQAHGVLVVEALAPVSGPEADNYCHYKMTITIEENKLKTRFETLRMTDQFYPSQKNMSELMNYYTRLGNDLKQALSKNK